VYFYRSSPEFESNELLIEFSKGIDDTSFFPHLLAALSEIQPIIESTDNIWMNDEVSINVNSEIGQCTISKDVWGFCIYSE